MNLPFSELLNPDKTYLSKDQLIKKFKEAGIEDPLSDHIIISCQRGITACVVETALKELGNPNTRLYDGSYGEYSELKNKK